MSPAAMIELTALAAIWGASFLFQRVASPVFGPVPLVSMRVTIAAIILVGALAARRNLGALRGHWTALAVVGAINSAIPFTLFAFATLSIPAGLVAVLNGTVPFFTALVGRLAFGERLEGSKVVGLGVGFGGLLLLVSGDLHGGARLVGIVAGLGASLLYGIAAHITKRRLATVEPLAVAAGSQLAASLLMLVPAILLWPAATPSRTPWSAAIALGVLCTGLAYVLFYRLIARVGPLQTIAVTYLIPIFGVLWGALFLAESVSLTMVVAALVILVGVTLTTGQWRRMLRLAPGAA